MQKEPYRSKEIMAMRNFSDIKSFIKNELPRRRIQIVETRLERKTSLLYERRLINSPYWIYLVTISAYGHPKGAESHF